MATGAALSIEGQKDLSRAFARLVVVSRTAAMEEVRAGILLVQRRAKKLTRMPGQGREYRRGEVVHRASRPFDPPAKDLNTLGSKLGSGEAIQYLNGGLVAEFGPRNYPVAAYLEFGTSKMAPRPFLFRSLEEERRTIVAGFERAFKRATGA